MKEIWKDVQGYEGIYEISNFGRVKSIERKSFNGKGFYDRKEYIMENHLNRMGYLYVHLCKNNMGRTIAVHRLVGKHFVEKVDNKTHLNHIDGNKLNNNVNNLEWVTPKENGEHAARLFLKANEEDHPSAKLTNNEVLNIYKSFKNGRYTIKELCNKYKVAYSTIYHITIKKYWKKILMEV